MPVHRTPPRSLRPAAAVAATLVGAMALAVVLGATAVESPSSADAATSSASAFGTSGVHPEDVGTNHLAGYQVSPAGGLASAAATFTVPTASCTAKDKTDGAEYWTGVFTDTVNTFALVQATCSATGVAYTVDYGTPAALKIAPGVNAGDVVVASMFQSASSTWAEVHDLTNGGYWVGADPMDVGDTSIDIGTADDVAFSNTPIPAFSSVTLSNVTVNGDDLGFESLTKYDSINGGVVLVKTGAVHTSAARSTFTERFKKGL